MTTIAYEKISENKFGELFRVSIIDKNTFKPCLLYTSPSPRDED